MANCGEWKVGQFSLSKNGNTWVNQKVGMKISKEWTAIQVTANGDIRQRQLFSLRKKKFEHKES